MQCSRYNFPSTQTYKYFISRKKNITFYTFLFVFIQLRFTFSIFHSYSFKNIYAFRHSFIHILWLAWRSSLYDMAAFTLVHEPSQAKSSHRAGTYFSSFRLSCVLALVLTLRKILFILLGFSVFPSIKRERTFSLIDFRLDDSSQTEA